MMFERDTFNTIFPSFQILLAKSEVAGWGAFLKVGR